MALIEAMVAVLVFAVGVLAMIGMQALAVKTASDAKYRADAAYLANQLIGVMWAEDRSALTTYRFNCANTAGCAPATNPTPGANGTTGCSTSNIGALSSPQAVKDWLTQYCAMLPGADLSATTVSVVTVNPALGTSLQTAPTYIVAVAIYWQLPADKATNTWHNYVTAAQIS